MPQGLLLIGWKLDDGPVIEAKYPDWLPDFSKEAVAIYNAHSIGFRRCGTIYLSLPKIKIVSYYAGAQINKTVTVILDRGERPDPYMEALEGLISENLQNGVDFKYELLTKIYKKLEKIGKAQSTLDKIIKLF
ncbi:MAG: hypothetical protein QW327_02970 [Candidatus Odinarchaeota archaeon]